MDDLIYFPSFLNHARMVGSTLLEICTHKLFCHFLDNWSSNDILQAELDAMPIRDPLSVAIPMTVVYVVILLSGLLGNISTCIVIAKNTYMHTATNYYLFRYI